MCLSESEPGPLLPGLNKTAVTNMPPALHVKIDVLFSTCTAVVLQSLQHHRPVKPDKLFMRTFRNSNFTVASCCHLETPSGFALRRISKINK